MLSWLIKALSIIRPAPAAPSPGRWGYFSGVIRTEWLPDGRYQKLIESVSYTDPAGRVWFAPAGSLTDGASVPRILWQFVGPFEGKYRDAAVIHDVACRTKAATWSDTHEMFRDAMLCSGVPEIQAAFMFAAVYRYGPRWLPPRAATLLGMDATTKEIADAAGPRQNPSASDLNRVWDAVERLAKANTLDVESLKAIGAKR
jgi:hypothetical protein